jgi:hypothetical protein
MTSRTKRAKHVEIERRYAWHARRQGAKYPALRRAELVRVFRGRLGGEMRRAELDRHIMAATGDDWASCGARILGGRINLTLEERMQYDVRTIQASDVTRAQARAAYAALRKQRDKERKRRDRARKMEDRNMSRDLSVRQETLFDLLQRSGHAMDVRTLATAVRNFPTWKRPDGRRLKPASLRTLVHRELDMLARQGKIRESRKVNRHGVAERRIQAVANSMCGQESVSVNTITEGVITRRGQRSTDEIITSRVNKKTSAHPLSLMQRLKPTGRPVQQVAVR